MFYGSDLETWKTYAALNSIPGGTHFTDHADGDLAAFMWWIQTTRWWSTTFPHAPTIRFEIAGNGTRNQKSSYAAQTVFGPEPEWAVSIDARMQYPVNVLHETAHCLQPRFAGDPERARTGAAGAAYRLHPHGPEFRGTLLALVERYGTRYGVPAGELAEAFKHFDAPVASLAEVQDAIEHSHVVAAAVEAADDERRIRWAADPEWAVMPMPSRVILPHPDQMPAPAGMGWGFWIYWFRERARPRITQKQLAAAIAPIMRLSPRTISRLEQAATKPADPRTLKVALAVAAILETDPVWLQEVVDLHPSPDTLTLDDLDAVAPAWTATYRRLAAQDRGRPFVRRVLTRAETIGSRDNSGEGISAAPEREPHD